MEISEREKLFELVGKEEVILFLGAGMSLYAGYPSGPGLAKIIYNELPEKLKTELKFTEDLPKLTNEIFYLEEYGKNFLNSIIIREFDKKPEKTEYHQILARIPQFQTIITTNYDSLVEYCNPSIHVIRNSVDYIKSDLRNQTLFKIHGDTKNLENLILTKNDYDEYFSKSSEQTIFWNAVKDKLASNNILFIGYSLEDSNIDTIIKKITDELGVNRKKMFFVNPNISQSKKGFLSKNNISFIESKGEDFIYEIMVYLKQNYFPGLQKGHGSPNTALRFADANNFKINIGYNDGNYEVSDNPNIITGFDLNVSLPSKHRKKLNNFIEGKTFESIRIEGNFINSINEWFNDFRIRIIEAPKFIELQKAPVSFGLIDIKFQNGEVYKNVDWEMYFAKPSKNLHIFKFKFTNFTLVLNLRTNDKNDISKVNLNIEANEMISDTHSSIEFYYFFYKILANNTFQIYREGKLIFEPKLNFFDIKEEKNRLREYLKNLKIIEDHFNIRFKNILLKETNETIVENILAYINQNEINRKFESLEIPIKNKELLEIFNGDKSRGIIYTLKEIIEVNIHGHNFKIGIPHYYIKDAYISNQMDIKESKSEFYIVKSKSNILSIKFLDELFD